MRKPTKTTLMCVQILLLIEIDDIFWEKISPFKSINVVHICEGP